MKPSPPPRHSAFDAHASTYDSDLQKGLSITGEAKAYYAEARVRWLRKCLGDLRIVPGEILDFGCGTGDSTPYLLQLNTHCRLTGLEVSEKSVELARIKHDSERARFLQVDELLPPGTIDLAFCNGVFHHIPPRERRACVNVVARSLRSGGIFSFWENNPWNPGTRYVMSRIPFDRDAVTLSYLESRRLLRGAGFEILRTDFHFFFPKFLHFVRPLDRFISALPFGGQYQVLCRKP